MVILDNTPIAQTLCVIPYKYNISFIYLGVNFEPFSAAIPFSTAFVPYKGLPLSDQMTFTERLGNAVSMYAPERPSIAVREIQKQAALHLIEWNFVLDYPVPTLPHVILIGQITPKHSRKESLSTELEDFLERSKHGVVLVSFGSIAPTTRNDVLDKMVSAFQETKYNYIIKGSFTNSTNKNLVVDWMPQKLLLTHPKIKLFITHCGANGLGEAISNGVPLLGFPLFAEQPGNAYRVQSRGFGLTMNLFEATKEEIVKGIDEVIDNPEYKMKVQRASEILKARDLNGLDQAIFWIEHVLKFGGEYLRSSGIDLPWYQYFLLDVIAFLLTCVSFMVSIIYFCLKCIFRRCVSRKLKGD
ncbi:hypothetical protein LOTGIDRAFT_170025 [Lottia gigantea]|uniref:UDP-glucuronosyltransferase n=1 Tax=Lottia gigantea TaxID=225164 RepID=V3YWK1_LOTGI|nr:hypothetical protein LOTGIDRAFT_170025 [Lottia gigantea]ESO82398.1 hypothetical protein LOTGIDRAFT_170025 [Lottia gigantea]